jgi:hypothetical protein
LPRRTFVRAAGSTAELLGGVLILAAIAAEARSRQLAWLLLLAGTLPVAVATWWSVVAPLLAVLAPLFGWMVTRRPLAWQRTAKGRDSRA